MDNMTAKVSCFAIEKHLNNAAMTEQYFAAYNARTPQHPITPPPVSAMCRQEKINRKLRFAG